VTFAQLRTAALFDPTAFRGLWRLMGMTSRPDDVYTDPSIVARIQQTLRQHGNGPRIVQPTREELLTALAHARAKPDDSYNDIENI
jgi:hypothetical protein